VSKKPRTPKPPRAADTGGRQVQAPQKRSGASRTAKPSTSSKSGSRYLWPAAGAVVVLAIVGIVLGVVLTRSAPAFALKQPIDWKTLPALQTGKPPWSNGGDTLSLRLGKGLGLNQLGQEQLAFHIHQHLDLYVDGKHVTVPTGVGFGIDPTTGKAQYITELHTHNSSGILHVESAQDLRYELGQFFGEWGVRLTSSCVGSFKGSCDNLQWWVNGSRRHGDPSKLVLKEHQEIVISVGKPPAKVAKTYDWAAHGV
jgi:hypothetical protein